MKTTKLFFAFFLLTTYSISSQAEITDSKIKLMTEKIGASTRDKNYTSIQTTIDEHCEINDYFEYKYGKTIYKRNEELEKIRYCLKSANASAEAAALSNGDLNSKLAVEQALSPATSRIKAESSENQTEVDFMGISWGLGFGYSISDNESVDEAEIVDGIVRVTSNKKQQPRLLLEFHKFLGCNSGKKDGTRGCGPFVAVAATQDEILSGVAMGFMYGFKARPSDSDGFSIGIGGILDADVKDLADGFKANEAAPSGETEVRFESESRWSAIIFVTRTF